MAKASPIRTAFNAGELSPLIDGRIDAQKYNNGTRIMENFYPTVQGPAARRPGTRYVTSVKNQNNRSWLVPFEFSSNQNFVLEFGDNYIRFYTNHGQVLITGSPAYDGTTAYARGDVVRVGSVNYYCRIANTGVAPPNLPYWWPMTGDIYEIPTGYPLSALASSDGTFAISTSQTGDVVYMAHPDYPLKKLSRFSNTRWIVTNVNVKNGPFKDINVDQDAQISVSGTTGTVTVTATKDIFNANLVNSVIYLEPTDWSTIPKWQPGSDYDYNPNGQRVRSDGKVYICRTNAAPTSGYIFQTGGSAPTHLRGIEKDGSGNPLYTYTSGGDRFVPLVQRRGLDWEYLHPSFGYVKITQYVDAKTVIGVVIGESGQLPDTSLARSFRPSWRWALSAFSTDEGYPSHVTFFRERLVLAKNQQLFFSKVGDFENFAALNESSQIVADQAISVTMSTDKADSIQWIAPGQLLLIGTNSGEFVCGENATTQAFAPGNVKIEQTSADGSRGCTPIRIGNSVLFMQRSGRKLKEMAYSFENNTYQTTDLSVLSEHITRGGVIQMAWHKEPYVAAWMVRGDGALLGFTFNKEQEVIGWHRHRIGTNASVESLCVIPNPNNDRDDLWMIVRRNIEGQTRRYVEYLERDYEQGMDEEDAFYVDGGATYEGVATTTISGVTHLIGKTVDVVANGAIHPPVVVSPTGTIDLQFPVTKAHVGLGYNSTLQLNRIEAGAEDGTAQGKTKRITKVTFRFNNTVGAKVGPDVGQLDLIAFRKPSDPMDQPVPFFTGDKLVEWPNGYDTEGYITIRQDQPLPMTVVAIMPQVSTFDR